jgi:hypothetical protein
LVIGIENRGDVAEEQEKAREPLLTRIEQLIDQILLDAAIPAQEIGHEKLRKLEASQRIRQAGVRLHRSGPEPGCLCILEQNGAPRLAVAFMLGVVFAGQR